MAFSHTIGGTIFTDASFQGNAYADEATGFPKALEKIVEHVANAYHGASTDALTVGTGAKVLTIANGSGQIPAFALGMPVRIARTSDPSGVWMQGEINAWDGATGAATINIDATKGSGSFSDWSIAIGGHLTIASGTPPLAVSQGGTGASSGKAALANLMPGVSGIIETNANFVDAAIFGPALDPTDWSSRTAAATSSLMLATVEDGGADAEVNIWDLTDDNLTGATPLATVTITGAAAPTSIAAAMGYIIVGSEGGITIIDPHDGSWAERTDGYPKSLSTTTNPVLNSNDVIGVAAGLSDKPAYDPRTGGPLPTFGIKWGSGTWQGAVYKDDGELWYQENVAATADKAVAIHNGRVFLNYDSDQLRWSSPISTINASQGVNPPYLFIYGDNDPYNVAAGVDKMSAHGKLIALASGEGLGFNLGAGQTHLGNAKPRGLNASITRAYNTGYYAEGAKGNWLANSKTADRRQAGAQNTLTENGTVTEAPVEVGAELKGYTFSSLSNYLNRAHDADFEFASGGMSMHCWIRSTSGRPSTEQCPGGWGDPAHVIFRWYNFTMTTAGKLSFYYYSSAGATGVGVQSNQDFADDKWHLMSAVFDTDQGECRMYVDGVLQDTQTHGVAGGGFTNASGQFYIGQERRGLYPCDQSKLALFRLSAAVPSATQIRQMYEAERGMFVANAKCLLQSGSTDAVLDVSVDPLTGKVAVTQTDAAMIFDGLVVESEPSIATGGTNWEHNLLYGGDRVEINDVNLYATLRAKDVREDLEVLRGLKVGVPVGVDLSKAKAWVIYDQTGTPSIEASYNVSSVEDLATGQFIVSFGVPFKHRPSATWSSDRNGDGVMNIDGNADRWGTSSVRFTHFHNTSGVGQDAVYSIVFFGELENE